MGLFFAMKIQLIKSENQQTSEWSGGTTTQLYIYPESADFSKRDFAYRISSAKVEIDESTFTPFPNYNRKLMVLEGVLDLYHEDHYTVLLHPFDQDAFSGNWISRSKGKVIDFNVIFSKDYSANLFHFELSKGEEIQLNCKQMTFLYVLYGNLIIDEKCAEIKDLFVMNGNGEVRMKVNSNTLIIATQLNKIED